MDRRHTQTAHCLLLAALLSHPAWSAEEQAQEAEPGSLARAARLIRVPVPIVGSVDTRVKQAITRLVDQWSAASERPVLILEFWPPEDETAGTGTEFERALSLARFLTSDKIERVRTVAYLPRSIRGHAVLPVIACEEIIMHPAAVLGEAGVDETSISQTVRQGYEEIANRRRTVPPPVALGMLDRQLKVYKAATPGGTRYVNEEQLEALQKETNVQSLDTIVAVGDLGSFTGKDARLVHGFASHLAADRRELAAALNLAMEDLDWDPSLGGQWQAMRADIEGAINDLSVNRVQRGIEDFVRNQRANLIWVCIDSPGGSPAASLRLANYLSALDSSEVRTIAYIAGEARADAAIIALACDHLIMSSSATLGGAGIHEPTAEEIVDLREAVREISNEKARRWSLPVAVIDPKTVVHRYTLEGSNVVEYFCAEELAEQQNPQRWRQGPEQTTPDETLFVAAADAEKLGLARAVVDNLAELKQLYQLETEPVALEPDWVDSLVEILASPQVAGMLLFVAGFALIGELSSPGLGVAGFISAVCFVIYFWSQTLNQTAGLLEILLFLTGVACIAVEIFVIPGIGVFGFGGGLLIVISLVLATQTFVIPKNNYQFQQLSYSFTTVLAAMAGMGVGVFILRKYIDTAPIIKHVLLNPPTGDELEERQQREAIVDFSHLLGCQGTTTTPVAPSGKAQFGKEVVDVISDGEFLSPGASIRVVDVQGNRVLIEPV